ncbi:ATP synthase subunit epsilon [Bacteroides fluxus]|uniref:ATP synthase, delta/epsilon subunit, beta-sandwich domain protein n=1 Tax=Bacteroides fluxus YIT 12057 TaxID=763034 RepID=F3PSN0_9BACE|nr:ATP synthase subunit epsilon [Bacteroides fluxus]EGF57432.1 ATP synthase, delta/epsilon subunit, beta-sandwich domain protein [Bacteroides fluxus YIT 12057]
MMKGLHLTIVSPEKELFNGEVERVTLPGTMGSFSILPQHAPIVSSLGAGTLVYVTGGEEHALDIQSGFVEMSNGKVAVCIEQQ